MSTRNPAHLATFTHRLSCIPGTDLAFNMAMIVLDEGFYSEDKDQDAIAAALTLWKRCCVDRRKETLSTFWTLARRATDDGDLNRSLILSCCACVLGTAPTHPTPADAYLL